MASDEIELKDLELPLLLMQHMHNDTTNTLNMLVEGYQYTIANMREAINATLERMDMLLDGDFAPSTNALYRALMPIRVYEGD